MPLAENRRMKRFPTLLCLVLATALAPSLAATKAKSPARAASAARAAPACTPGEPSFFRDEALTMKVATKLQFTKALLREKVNVKVSGGVAMLWGGLSSAEAVATAARLAGEVEGVRCVNNQLRVGPPDADEPGHTGNGG